jgi:Arc/MetJ-type ribon-helix-helix transcriptional regulator
MEPITVSLTDEQYAKIESLASDEGEYSSQSDAVRTLLDRSFEYESLTTEIAEKEDRINKLEQRTKDFNEELSDKADIETENERLRNEKRTLIAEKEEKQELREYASQAKSAIERREERREKRRKQPVWVRLQDWIFGE